MPKGPKGQKRPADVIGAAVMVAKIATGEIEDTVKDNEKNPKDTAKRGKTAKVNISISGVASNRSS